MVVHKQEINLSISRKVTVGNLQEAISTRLFPLPVDYKKDATKALFLTTYPKPLSNSEYRTEVYWRFPLSFLSFLRIPPRNPCAQGNMRIQRSPVLEALGQKPMAAIRSRFFRCNVYGTEPVSFNCSPDSVQRPQSLVSVSG